MLELPEQIILIVFLHIGNWDVIHRVLPWLQLRSSLIHFACIGVAPTRLFTLQIFTLKRLCYVLTLLLISLTIILYYDSYHKLIQCLNVFCFSFFLIFCVSLYGEHFLKKMLGMDANLVIEKLLWPRLIETAYNDLFTLY